MLLCKKKRKSETAHTHTHTHTQYVYTTDCGVYGSVVGGFFRKLYGARQHL